MAKSKAERGRFSSRKKMDVVLRVLRVGEFVCVTAAPVGGSLADVCANKV